MYFIFTVAEGIYLFTSGVPDQSQDMCTSYIEQATSGRGIKLHCILFNVDDYDANGAIPGRYANITRTGECLRNMAHCSGGRFHWFRETGNDYQCRQFNLCILTFFFVSVKYGFVF